MSWRAVALAIVLPAMASSAITWALTPTPEVASTTGPAAKVPSPSGLLMCMDPADSALPEG